MPASSRDPPKALRPECTWPGCHRRTRNRGQPLRAQHQQERPQRDNARQRAQKRAAADVAESPFVVHVPLDKYTDSLMTTLKLDGMTTRCDFCLAWNFADEKVHSAGGRRVTLCCKAGKICHLPTPPDAPEPLRSLLLDSTRLARHFRQNIRRYNAAMSFVSFGARLEIKTGGPLTRSPPVCIVHGAVYHHSHPLRPQDDSEAQFAQLYLYDAQEAMQARCPRDTALRADILDALHTLLQDARTHISAPISAWASWLRPLAFAFVICVFLRLPLILHFVKGHNFQTHPAGIGWIRVLSAIRKLVLHLICCFCLQQT